MQPEPFQVLVAQDQGPVGTADLHLEIAESVEGVCAAAGCDAAAVLRPWARILDVPELSVSRGHAGDGAQVCNARRRDERGNDQAFQESHRVTILRRMNRAAALLVLYIFCATSLRGQDRQAQDDTAKPAEGFTLKTAETITFTTDEVTWMQVDVSPDGQTILFDLLGDLYTLPIGGGEAKRIVGGLSFESQPTWSPDAKTIAFLSDRTGVENLWIANADGSNPRAVSKDCRTNDRPQIMVSPEWTPDGNYIVVSKSRPPEPGTFGLFMYHRDGGTGVRVGPAPPPQPGPDAQGPPPPPPTNKMGALVSPDGRFIYYTQRTGTFTYNARFPMWQIYRHDTETGDVMQITNAQGSAIRPVLSPDGKSLVFGTRHKGADRPPGSQSGDRRRAMARLPCDT